MKILHVYPYFYPAWGFGGVVRVVYEMGRGLVKRGHEVSVYTTDCLGPGTRILNANCPTNVEGIDVYYFRNISNVLASKYVIAVPIPLLFDLQSKIQCFDIIHMHGARTFPNILVQHSAKKLGIPCVLQTHGALMRFEERGAMKRVFDFFAGDRVIRESDKLVAVSPAEVRQFTSWGIDRDRYRLVPNGIDVERFNILPKRGQFRLRYNLGEENLILFLGRTHKRKGIDLVLKSFSKVVKSRRNLRLVIAGQDHGERREMERLCDSLRIANSVTFTGYLEDVLEAYVDASVLVHPAVDEIFGLVPLEAIMCGTPVIVADDCGCGELLKESDGGYLVRPDDVNGLAQQIEFVLDNPEECRKKTENGRKFIVSQLSLESVITRIEGLYEDCIRDL